MRDITRIQLRCELLKYYGIGLNMGLTGNIDRMKIENMMDESEKIFYGGERLCRKKPVKTRQF